MVSSSKLWLHCHLLVWWRAWLRFMPTVWWLDSSFFRSSTQLCRCSASGRRPSSAATVRWRRTGSKTTARRWYPGVWFFCSLMNCCIAGGLLGLPQPSIRASGEMGQLQQQMYSMMSQLPPNHRHRLLFQRLADQLGRLDHQLPAQDARGGNVGLEVCEKYCLFFVPYRCECWSRIFFVLWLLCLVAVVSNASHQCNQPMSQISAHYQHANLHDQQVVRWILIS